MTKYWIIIIISFPGPDYLAKIRVKKYGMNQHFFFSDVSLQSILIISTLSLNKLKYQTIVLVQVSITVNELYVL